MTEVNMGVLQQRIPTNSREREALRQKGQFWTPDWIADAMTGYVLSTGSDQLFDPAVGAGAFFRAGKLHAVKIGREIALSGTEVDPEVLQQARMNGLVAHDLAQVEIRDFITDPPTGLHHAIIANPPYIRHHRLPQTVKASARKLAVTAMGRPLDGRAGLHIYFLVQSLQMLSEGGRLAFIMPADTCEGVFAPALWHWITTRYRLDAVLTFDPQASPFPGVDTNPIVFMIERAAPRKQLFWVRLKEPKDGGLWAWVVSGFKQQPEPSVLIQERELSEALATGLSRPETRRLYESPMLGDYAQVLRGIATGNNDFFFLTRSQAASLEIPDEFLVTAVGRTRDVNGDEISHATLEALDATGRPTLLLSLDGRPVDAFPSSVQRYLKHGVENGLPAKSLIGQRHPWYKMETRQIPPILFAYLGRRNTRFIRNTAGVRPLTGFLCIYPRSRESSFIERLWKVLGHPATLTNLSLVGKSYGAGAIKVEPRALEHLPLPENVVSDAGLRTTRLV